MSCEICHKSAMSMLVDILCFCLYEKKISHTKQTKKERKRNEKTMSCCSTCKKTGHAALDCYLAQSCNQTKSCTTKCKTKKPDNCFILKGRCAEEICLQYKAVPGTTIGQTKNIYVDSKTGYKYVVKSIQFPNHPQSTPISLPTQCSSFWTTRISVAVVTPVRRSLAPWRLLTTVPHRRRSCRERKYYILFNKSK